MAPQGAAYNIDWVISTNSNVHVANHRDWFTDYVEFPTHISFYGATDNTIKALGVGTVVLEMKLLGNKRPGKARAHRITLRNVLFVPAYEINVVGSDFMNEYSYGLSSGSAAIKNRNGQIVGHTARTKLWRLWLKGQAEKQSSLATDKHYIVNATWPDQERARFEAVRTKAYANQTAPSGGHSDVPPYTTAEADFLKIRYGGEYNLLRQFGLSIYKEEDREEGRQILRAMMPNSGTADTTRTLNAFGFRATTNSDHEDERDEDDEAADSDDGDSFLADLERDPASHAADYHFSKPQLKWIKRHFGHSGNKLLSYGLKPWDDENGHAGVQLVEQMMAGRD